MPSPQKPPSSRKKKLFETSPLELACFPPDASDLRRVPSKGVILSGVHPKEPYGPQLFYGQLVSICSSMVPLKWKNYRGLSSVNQLYSLHFCSLHHPKWRGVLWKGPKNVWFGPEALIALPHDFVLDLCVKLSRQLDLSSCLSITVIPEKFLSRNNIHELALPSNTQVIEAFFLQRSTLSNALSLCNCKNLCKIGANFLNEATLMGIVDLSECTQLQCIPTKFLSSCNALGLKLPPSTTRIGDEFLYRARLGATLSLSNCPLLAEIGAYFGHMASFSGDVDLQHCVQLTNIPIRMLNSASGIHNLLLPCSIVRIGKNFLWEASLRQSLSFAMCTDLDAIDEQFLACSKVSGGVNFRGLLKLVSLGSFFLYRATVNGDVVLPTALETVDTNFFAGARIGGEVNFADCVSLRTTGVNFLQGASLKGPVDLSRSKIGQESVPHLSGATLVIRLPPGVVKHNPNASHSLQFEDEEL